jgi:hypothetical protein
VRCDRSGVKDRHGSAHGLTHTEPDSGYHTGRHPTDGVDRTRLTRATTQGEPVRMSLDRFLRRVAELADVPLAYAGMHAGQ